jgi:hypothetical protein
MIEGFKTVLAASTKDRRSLSKRIGLPKIRLLKAGFLWQNLCAGGYPRENNGEINNGHGSEFCYHLEHPLKVFNPGSSIRLIPSHLTRDVYEGIRLHE